MECVYDRPVTSNGSPSSTISQDTPFPATSRQTETMNSPVANCCHLLSEESRDRRYREMRLLHYFTVEVTTTFPGYYLPEVKQIWSVDVPIMAMEYKPLLNSIMALSILHMTYTENTRGMLRPDQLVSQGAQYLEATLQEYREGLGSLDKKIADPASFTSVILSLHAFASLRDRHLQPYLPPTEWLQMCKGVMNVFRITMTFVRNDPTSKINVVNESSAGFVEPSAIFCEANRNRFPYLLVSQPRESDNEEDQEAYASTLCFIGALLAAQDAGEPFEALARKVVIFPILFPMRFVDLLNMRRARALVILAHFFGAASRFGGSWWVGDCPRREVRAIADYLGSDWQYQMAWPLDAIQQAEISSNVGMPVR